MFKPKILDTLKNYSRRQFSKDLIAGLIVGIVALPLAIAFAIASGVSPEKGLFTAIIAGFIISAFGGSRVQIGGPTGAFIVIVYGIVQQYGMNGLIIATFIAGFMLMLMGFARFGSVIKFIPHPLIVGFTTGIAVIIFSSQMKDFFGLSMGAVPADFIEKWKVYFHHVSTINWYAIAIGAGTVIIILLSPKLTRVVPGSLIAILLATIAVQIFHLPVETIGSRFGSIPSSLPLPMIPHLDWDIIKNSIQPAFTIAILGGIESLLSAVVADGMIGGNHKSNLELVAQGGANIASALFGGIPATGAIARTATNVKNGGRTPVAGMVHALTLFIIMLAVGKWATLIPMSCLAGVLVIVAYNMSEYETFIDIAKGSRSDAAVLVTTFLLTVLFDLTLAIEIGMVLAVFLFMRRMIKISNVSNLLQDQNDSNIDDKSISKYKIPKEVEVFELSGPMFFGAAYKFKDAIKVIEKKPKVLIVRMRNVPVIDSTGIHTIKDVLHMCRHDKIQLIVSGIQPPVLEEFRKARLLFQIGKRYVTDDFETALQRAGEVLARNVKEYTNKFPTIQN
ncbi:sulfate permease [Chitinophagaceae bacterium LB-8]|uniref:Sulfate permease n=1 Tax=Paraflavisolibacter caeni TaxID=2982496 RepID=A0A9X3B9P8_9BACT|nr:sulfate permease [Paraflavisolibacter caeni]MCU7552290.1 sulfate permease [Paraflavisolibacter caeni]